MYISIKMKSVVVFLILCIFCVCAENNHLVSALKDTFSASNPRIVGGQEANPHLFPYLVGLRLFTNNGSTSICGGSLISDEWVLTAAHCLDGISSVSVKLGAHKLNKAQIEQSITRNRFIIHPEWDRHRIRNDIALLKLNSPVAFNETISSINLPRITDMQNKFYDETATASGWGTVKDGTTLKSSVLRYVNLTVVDARECRQIYGSSVELSNICASGSDGRSICDGDSGGPLVIPESDGSKILIGIASYGSERCESGEPIVFARVTSFLHWIESNAGIKIRK